MPAKEVIKLIIWFLICVVIGYCLTPESRADTIDLTVVNQRPFIDVNKMNKRQASMCWLASHVNMLSFIQPQVTQKQAQYYFNQMSKSAPTKGLNIFESIDFIYKDIFRNQPEYRQRMLVSMHFVGMNKVRNPVSWLYGAFLQNNVVEIAFEGIDKKGVFWVHAVTAYKFEHTVNGDANVWVADSNDKKVKLVKARVTRGGYILFDMGIGLKMYKLVEFHGWNAGR